MGEAETIASNEGLSHKTVMALVAMAVAVFVVANDFTALSVALPQIEKDFHVDVTTAQWVINGYALVFGVLIVSGARLADMLGRRRVFFAGAACLPCSRCSGACAGHRGAALRPRGDGSRRGADVARDPGYDLRDPAVRQGGTCRRADPRRGRTGKRGGAAARWSLTDAADWRWIFFLNVPVSAFAVYVTWRNVHLSETLNHDTGSTTSAWSRYRSGCCACWWRSIRAADWASPTLSSWGCSPSRRPSGRLRGDRAAGRGARADPRDVLRNRRSWLPAPPCC